MSSDDKSVNEAEFVEHVEHFGGSPEYVEALRGKTKQRSYGSYSLFERTKFFASVVLELLIDSVYLILVYLWYLFINQITKGLSLSGYESMLLTILKFVLLLGPAAIVLWYIVVDFIGTGRRIWEFHRGSADM
jgi:hypothetical protein